MLTTLVIWKIALASVGIALIYFECSKQDFSWAEDFFAKRLWDYTWIGLGIALIGESLGYSEIYYSRRLFFLFTDQDFNSLPDPDFFAGALLLIAVLRILFVKMSNTYLDEQKTPGDINLRELVGSEGHLLKDLHVGQTALIKIEKPSIVAIPFECFSDSVLKAGSYVKVIEVDFNLLKVTGATA